MPTSPCALEGAWEGMTFVHKKFKEPDAYASGHPNQSLRDWERSPSHREFHSQSDVFAVIALRMRSSASRSPRKPKGPPLPDRVPHFQRPPSPPKVKRHDGSCLGWGACTRQSARALRNPSPFPAHQSPGCYQPWLSPQSSSDLVLLGKVSPGKMNVWTVPNGKRCPQRVAGEASPRA